MSQQKSGESWHHRKKVHLRPIEKNKKSDEGDLGVAKTL